MKRIAKVIWVILLFALLSCAMPQKKDVEYVRISFYEMSMLLPADWQVRTEIISGTESRIALSPDLPIGITLQRLRAPDNTPIDNATFRNAVKSGIEGAGGLIEFDEIRTLGGKPAFTVIYLTGNGARATNMMVSHRMYYYSFQIVADSNMENATMHSHITRIRESVVFSVLF